MTFTKDDFKRVLWTAVQAFLAAFYALATGLGRFPNLTEAKAFLWAAALAGLAAGASALKNLVLADGTWAK